MQNWIDSYYVPNPYVPSMNSVLDNPINISKSLIQCISKHGAEIESSKAINEVFEDEIGNSDILLNTLKEYSRWFFVRSHLWEGGGGTTKYINIQNAISLNDNQESVFKLPPDQYNNHKVFFEHFSIDEKEQFMMDFNHLIKI